jgi:dihydrofolate reductase
LSASGGSNFPNLVAVNSNSFSQNKLSSKKQSMGSPTSKITIHMVASLDGFVAKADNSVGWMHSQDEFAPGIELTEEYVAEFLASIDCYVMGARTYAHALELGWPYGDVPVYVIGQQPMQSHRPSVHFRSGDLQEIVLGELKPKYAKIWMAGGPTLAKSFLQAGLADEISISLLPVLLGGGKLYFDYIGREVALHLKSSTTYKDGTVELCYEVKKA